MFRKHRYYFDKSFEMLKKFFSISSLISKLRRRNCQTLFCWRYQGALWWGGRPNSRLSMAGSRQTTARTSYSRWDLSVTELGTGQCLEVDRQITSEPFTCQSLSVQLMTPTLSKLLSTRLRLSSGPTSVLYCLFHWKIKFKYSLQIFYFISLDFLQCPIL